MALTGRTDGTAGDAQRWEELGTREFQGGKESEQQT